MVWVASFALWSGVVGLAVAAASGDTLDAGDSVSVGVSALFYVALSAVPTICALVFNDWARDGFPTRTERVSRAARPRVAGLPELAPAVSAPAVSAPAVSASAGGPSAQTDIEPAQPGGPETRTPVARPPGPMMPAPLGVPAPAVTPPAPADGFPVAPLLRDVADR
jgi:hypothetical protein